MTLTGDCDFKLENFVAGPVETFMPFYGDEKDGDKKDGDKKDGDKKDGDKKDGDEKDGDKKDGDKKDGNKMDGDITRWANLASFAKFVHESTKGTGVHVVMADGVS